jgi:hypothetical protein
MTAHEEMLRKYNEHNWRTRDFFRRSFGEKIIKYRTELSKTSLLTLYHVGITLTPHPKA